MTVGASLQHLGWSADLNQWGEAIDDGLSIGRVVRVDRGEVDVAFGLAATDDLRATSTTAAKDCVAGDWVAVDRGLSRVESIAPRYTAFVRRASRGARTPQTLAANVDVVVVVSSMHPELNVRRLERELVMAHDSGARVMVVLTKRDLLSAPEVESVVQAARAVAPGAEVFAVSTTTLAGFDGIEAVLTPGVAFAFLGASGVGKSSLANALADEPLQLVGEVREVDGKGRHTTTAARLLRLTDGRLLLDTPGVRALALWESWDGLAAAFIDIETLAEGCQFSDCFHDDEPRCAVIAAAKRGDLDPARLENWRRMRDEMAELDADLTEGERRRQRTGRPEVD